MQRYDVINNLIKGKGYKSYLEIGVQNGVTVVTGVSKIKDIRPYEDTYTWFDNNRHILNAVEYPYLHP